MHDLRYVLGQKAGAHTCGAPWGTVSCGGRALCRHLYGTRPKGKSHTAVPAKWDTSKNTAG